MNEFQKMQKLAGITPTKDTSKNRIRKILKEKFEGSFEDDSFGEEYDLYPNDEDSKYDEYESDIGLNPDLYENLDDEEFTPQGFYSISNAGGYEIMLDTNSTIDEMAKVRNTVTGEISDWLQIEYIPDEQTNEMIPIIDPSGYNIPLDQVMQINNESFGEGFELEDRKQEFGINPEKDYGFESEEDGFDPEFDNSSWDDNFPEEDSLDPDWMLEEKKDKEEEKNNSEEIEDDDDTEFEETEEAPEGNPEDIQSSLQTALEGARALGDEKLINQIGNTLTFYVRSHVVKGGEEETEAPSLETEFDPEELENLQEIRKFRKIAGLIK